MASANLQIKSCQTQTKKVPQNVDEWIEEKIEVATIDLWRLRG